MNEPNELIPAIIAKTKIANLKSVTIFKKF
jgi:hypothetical protein